VRGRGTPAPFDPPRKLVIAGPYRFVRNPMYIGAAVALAGAALFYASWWLMAYVAAFLAILHVFVLTYEEPTLRATFGVDYATYTARVHRWIPHAAAWLASGILLLRGVAGVIVNKGQDPIWDPAFIIGGIFFGVVAWSAIRKVRPA
jgi:hypothetical protein